jgi:3-oxoacyl-[acyl-carrier protein] reductase
MERLRQLVPSPRLGAIADVVAAVVYLLSEEAGYVTGVTIPVAGGYGL